MGAAGHPLPNLWRGYRQLTGVAVLSVQVAARSDPPTRSRFAEPKSSGGNCNRMPIPSPPGQPPVPSTYLAGFVLAPLSSGNSRQPVSAGPPRGSCSVDDGACSSRHWLQLVLEFLVVTAIFLFAFAQSTNKSLGMLPLSLQWCLIGAHSFKNPLLECIWLCFWVFEWLNHVKLDSCILCI